MKKEDLIKLKKELLFKWRVQSASQYGAIMVPYIDARDQMALLDEVCGMDGWSDSYQQIGDRLICSLSINVEGLWISKSDAGVDSKIEKEKGGISDAFKRAGVKWGINRQAYETEALRLPVKEYKSKWYPVNEKGNFLKGEELNKYCNIKSNEN